MTYIDPRRKVWRHLDRLAGWDQGERPAPVTIEWDLSNRCVLGCQDCHFAHTHSKGPWVVKPRRLPMAYESTGDLADVPVVLRTLDEMAAVGVRSIVWSGGGEPTTHPAWPEIIEAASRAGLAQGMYTLGGLLSSTTAAHLTRHLQWVVVSLDAVDAETYAHEKGVAADRFHAACDGIRGLAASASNCVVGVSFLLHAQNVAAVETMRALTQSLGGTYTLFRPAIRTQADAPAVPVDDRRWIPASAARLAQMATYADVEIDLARFENYADWQGHGYRDCYGIRLNTTVTPDSRVWICPQRRGVTALGDLRDESFATVWARHPGVFAVDAGCRLMCRLHPVNQELAAFAAPQPHDQFV